MIFPPHVCPPPYIFPDQVKFGACYVTGEWEWVQNKTKNALIYFQELFFWQFLLFFIIKFTFLS